MAKSHNKLTKSTASSQLGNRKKRVKLKNTVPIAIGLRNALSNLPDGVCVVSDHAIVYINQRGAEIFGYDSPDLVPKQLDALKSELDLHYLDGHKVSAHNHTIELGLHEKSAHRELVIINPKNHEKRILRIVVSSVEKIEEKITSSLAIYHDITEQKQAKAALEKSKTQFQFVVQNAADVVTVFKADGFITYQSPSIARVLGRDSKARIGANIFDSAFVHPEDKRRKYDFLVNLIKAKPGARLKGEFRLQHADGSWRDLEAVGVNLLHDPNLQAIILSSRDITERKHAEVMLRESEEHFRFMAELLPQKIFTANSSGKVTYFNSQWVDYTGLSLDELKRQGVQQFIHPNDLTKSMQTWEQAIQGGTHPLHNEQRLRRSDGQYRRHISHVRAMYDKTGKIVRWFGSMTDIEDIAQAVARKEELEQKTAALTKQRAQLIEINNTKDEFISLASHQLRTPATSVKQYVGMLLQGYAGTLTALQRDFLQRAYNSNERQINIVNDLLKTALIDAGKVKPQIDLVSLETLITETIEGQTAKFAEKNQTVSFHGLANKCIVLADRDLLRMALENIIDNASKYTYEGKSITVRLQESQGKANVIIQDEGVGIPADKLNKLFNKFSRLDNPLSVSVGGTGLGLYWAKKVIELHHGTIKVASKEDKGTTFTIKLPI